MASAWLASTAAVAGPAGWLSLSAKSPWTLMNINERILRNAHSFPCHCNCDAAQFFSGRGRSHIIFIACLYEYLYVVIMDVFVTGLCVLSLLCALIYKQSTHPTCRDPQFAKFKKTYLFVYLIATGRLRQTSLLPSYVTSVTHHWVDKWFLQGTKWHHLIDSYQHMV